MQQMNEQTDGKMENGACTHKYCGSRVNGKAFCVYSKKRCSGYDGRVVVKLTRRNGPTINGRNIWPVPAGKSVKDRCNDYDGNDHRLRRNICQPHWAYSSQNLKFMLKLVKKRLPEKCKSKITSINVNISLKDYPHPISLSAIFNH